MNKHYAQTASACPADEAKVPPRIGWAQSLAGRREEPSAPRWLCKGLFASVVLHSVHTIATALFVSTSLRIVTVSFST